MEERECKEYRIKIGFALQAIIQKECKKDGSEAIRRNRSMP